MANAGLLDKMGKLCSCLFSISVLDQRVNDVTDFIKKCITSEAFRQFVIELCFFISCWQSETITFLFYFFIADAFFFLLKILNIYSYTWFSSVFVHYCLGNVVTIMLVYQSLLNVILWFACFVLSPECYTVSWENLINVFFVFFLHKVMFRVSCSTFAFGLLLF